MSALERNYVVMSGQVSGRPMLFAHGFGCDQQMWRYVTPFFEDSHRVITFDHVGCGGSDASAYDLATYGSLGGYVRDVLDIVHELDLRDVVFVGHSVSAMIGVLASIAEPDRFAALALVAPSPRYLDDDGYDGGFRKEDIDELIDSLDSNYLGWSSAITPVIMGNPDRPELTEELEASFCRVDPKIARQFARVTFRGDNRDDLAKVSVPTLVIQCSDDVIAPTQVGEFVHRAITDSEFVLLEVSGHCPNLSAPEQTAAAINGFVQRLPGPG